MSLNARADLATLLRDIVDIESVSGNEERLADEVEAVLRECDHLSVERNGNCVIARTHLGRDERVVIAGHLDTVPVAGNLPSRLEDHPDGPRVYGRGTCDMKGGVAVALQCAVTLAEPVRDVTWIFYDNEEIAQIYNGLRRISIEQPDLLAGDFAVLMEPTGAQLEGGCQGTLRVRITATGLAAHSARSWKGDNAIHKLASALDRLEPQPDPVAVDGLEYRPGWNAVRISGGVAGNVIPDRCQVEVNYRFAPDRSGEEALAEITEKFAEFDVEPLDVSPGARPGLDHPAAAEFVAAIGVEPRAKYGWTDVARFSALGVPAVNFGPGDPNKAHADDEFCPVADLEFCADALTRWLEGDT